MLIVTINANYLIIDRIQGERCQGESYIGVAVRFIYLLTLPSKYITNASNFQQLSTK